MIPPSSESPDPARLPQCATPTDRHRGRSYVLTGPDKLTIREQVDAISVALGEPIGFQPIGPAQALDELQARGGWGAAAGRAVLHLDAPPGSNTPSTGLETDDHWITEQPYAGNSRNGSLGPDDDFAGAAALKIRLIMGGALQRALELDNDVALGSTG